MPRPTKAEVEALFAGGNLRLISFDLSRGEVAQKLDAAGAPMFDEEGAAVSGPTNTRWHQIALEGEWKGHHQGPFKLTRRDLEQAKFLFDSLSNDACVDYEHNTYNWMAAENPAAAWIDAMEIRDGDGGSELWGRFKWTANAAARIDADEYRYLSPAISWHTKDRKSGKDLGTSIHTVALTNTPFLDELPELSLNSSWLGLLSAKPQKEQNPMDEKQLIQLAASLGLPVNSTPEQIIAHCSALTSDVGPAVERLATELGCAGATLEVMIATAEGLKKENANLSIKAARVDEIEAEQRISKARAEGKIDAANEEWATKLASSSPEIFDGWAASASPRVKPGEIKTAATVPIVDGDPAEAEIKRLCAIPEIIAMANKSGLKGGVEAFVRPNVRDLLIDFS